MKIKRIIIFLLVALLILMTLAACSKSDPQVGEIIYLHPYECKVGDIVQFGPYEWRILEIRENNFLLITEDILTSRPFYSNPNGGVYTWEDCELRQWLNDEFLEMFSSEEIVKIIEARIINSNDPSGNDDTKDRVFLLSFDEVKEYFPNNTRRRARYSEFNNERYKWILRTPGLISGYLHCVDEDGKVGSSLTLGISGGGVRPALWLRLE